MASEVLFAEVQAKPEVVEVADAAAMAETADAASGAVKVEGGGEVQPSLVVEVCTWRAASHAHRARHCTHAHSVAHDCGEQ